MGPRRADIRDARRRGLFIKPHMCKEGRFAIHFASQMRSDFYRTAFIDSCSKRSYFLLNLKIKNCLNVSASLHSRIMSPPPCKPMIKVFLLFDIYLIKM